METISFEDLGLDSATLAAIEAKGFETPSPIQVLAIPRLIDGDANVIAKARTGTGKTAAFGLPLVQKIRSDSGFPQALVLTPTRELALQVCKEIESLATGRFPRLTSVYGGQSMSEQLRALKRGTEIVVGTPGRVKDHLERGSLKLENISYFILDEADEMLDMGFIDDIEFIFSKANPKSRILLFSATMPPQILKIASKFMGDYEIVEEEERPEEPLLTEQRYWVVRESEKIEALVRLIDISPDFYGLVFTQTKADADSISRQLDERGYEAAALHGDIAQNQREKILYRFRNKKTRILVATDVAARGIDIEGLTHVVNYALPYDGPTYVHRIGRTGRAGAKGLAFTLVRPEERRRVDYLKQFSKKATLGDLREDTIPSVDQVLAVKRQRLFDEMKTSLGINGQEEGEGADVSAAEPFLSMAEELCASGNATEVLAAVLAQSYGRALDPTRYGDISSMKAQASLGKQVRIFVQLGRKDGFDAREIASYFSGLLGIPPRMVDRIDTAQNFTLVSLPYQAGMDILEKAKRDSTLPHMHLDSKDSETFDRSRPRSSEGRSGGSDARRGGRRGSYGGAQKSYSSGGSRRNSSPSAGRGFSSEKPRTSNASLYKKNAVNK